MILRVKVEDSAYTGGVGDSLVNVDHIVWMGAHPQWPDKTMARLTSGDVLLILAPFSDLASEFDA